MATDTYDARIVADSLSPDGIRLTTFQVTMPRIVLAEFNTHRVFSRNSASSRAIPVKKMIERVLESPYIPSSWGKNQRGMQAGETVNEYDAKIAERIWLDARDVAVKQAKDLGELGIHKQLTNRLLEPFMWHTCIVTATEWDNFFHLRNHEHAHPDIQIPARLMQEIYEANEPQSLEYDQWHLPFVEPEDYESELPAAFVGSGDLVSLAYLMVKVSCARCARVSYMTHDGKRDLNKDLELHDGLLIKGHMSPFEHAARPMAGADVLRFNLLNTSSENVDLMAGEAFLGNFRGWVQYRKLIPGEGDMLGEQS